MTLPLKRKQWTKPCDLTFKEKTMDGWWLVKCGSKQGRVPATNLRRANTAKAQHIIEIGSQVDSEKKVSSI